MLLIFINGLFQGFSLELWFHNNYTSQMSLNITLDFFFLILTTALYHTLFQLCGHHKVLEKLHITKTVSFSLSKSVILAKL